MEYTTLFHTSDKARVLLQETLLEAPDTFLRPIDTIANFKSIKELCAHIIGAEMRWVEQRLLGKPADSKYEEIAPNDMEQVFHDWNDIRVKTWQVINGLSQEGLERKIYISLPMWNFETELTVDQALFHLINHETFHRGQISMALQQFGVDPPNFDIVFLL